MKAGRTQIIAFGNLAIMARDRALDPWLCVPTFRWVCPYRRDLIYYVINLVKSISFDGIGVNTTEVLDHVTTAQDFLGASIISR